MSMIAGGFSWLVNRSIYLKTRLRGNDLRKPVLQRQSLNKSKPEYGFFDNYTGQRLTF